jgi:CubicO group peptidase (beta-lactamase class C family)
MAETRIAGLLAINHGRIILERYGLGETPDDRWISFSVTKSITSTLIGAAIKDGYIKSLDDPVARYIQEMKGSVYETVSIRQLITMTSGVKWNENYADPNNDAVRVGVVPGDPGVNPIVSYMRKLTRAEPPGIFRYKTGETDLAGILVSSATGKSLAEYLSEKIWQPFGMERDAVWPEDAGGHERGGCCLAMTLRDYGRFGLFMLQNGVASGKAMLPDGWVADATSTHVVAEGYHPAATGYGYFWWTRPMDAYEAVGIYGQSITIFPKDDLVIVVNAAWPKPTGMTDARLAFMLAIRDAARGLN